MLHKYDVFKFFSHQSWEFRLSICHARMLILSLDIRAAVRDCQAKFLNCRCHCLPWLNNTEKNFSVNETRRESDLRLKVLHHRPRRREVQTRLLNHLNRNVWRPPPLFHLPAWRSMLEILTTNSVFWLVFAIGLHMILKNLQRNKKINDFFNLLEVDVNRCKKIKWVSYCVRTVFFLIPDTAGPLLR